MEAIDIASQRLSAFIAELHTYDDTIFTEQDTRVKVLDRVFLDVLGWPKADLRTEAQAGAGFIDYQFLRNGRSRLILEAKRDGLAFGLANRQAARPYKLNGATFSDPATKSGILQAIAYCAHKNAELACVSNGREYVIFRGSRLGDGKDTLDGMAFVFPSLEAVQENFKKFYALLSPESVDAFEFRAHFQEAEGQPIRASSFTKALRNQSSRQLAPHGELANDLDRVMTSFFRRLTGDNDPELLAQCFVTTKDSARADARLSRISEDLVHRLRGLDTDSAEELTRLVEATHARQGHEFVIIVGTKGAGKSTFIDRFFRYVLPKHLAHECVVARINVGESDGSDTAISTWLDRRVLEELEKALFGQEPPSFDELQGMFFDEYQRRSQGTLKHLYESNKQDFKIDFGRHVEERRESRPHEYIERLLQHVVKSRKKIPCLVFDNADHFTIEFQERVFQFARSLYEKTLCLVILPVTDRTTWHLSRDGALRSFEVEALHLPTPSTRAILEKRISFIRTKLQKHSDREQATYFIGRGIRLSLADLKGFGEALQDIFVRTGRAAQCIANLANHDIRRCLEVARHVVVSPHLATEELLKAHVTGTAKDLRDWKVTRALICGRYDIYPEGEHEFVVNMFALAATSDGSPLLGCRILQLLLDAKSTNKADPFVSIDQVLQYFAAMQVDTRSMLGILSKLLESGLVQSYDPTVLEIKQVSRLQITPSGFQHLKWALKNTDYLQAMLPVTPIRDPDVFDRLEQLAQEPRREVWSEELDVFSRHILDEDALWVRTPQHESHRSQAELPGRLRAAVIAKAARKGIQLPN